MHIEKPVECPFCHRMGTHVILPDGDKWVAWCQRCFRARFIEPEEAQLPPEQEVERRRTP